MWVSKIKIEFTQTDEDEWQLTLEVTPIINGKKRRIVRCRAIPKGIMWGVLRGYDKEPMLNITKVRTRMEAIGQHMVDIIANMAPLDDEEQPQGEEM